MRTFIAVLVLIFSLQSWTKADDISDFEIEGMSIGDSLLDYMNINQIKKAIKNEKTFFYGNKYASISAWDIREKFKIYDNVGIIIDPNDNNYEILSLEGTFTTKNGDIQNCYKKQIEIANDIEKTIDPKYKRDVWFLEKKRLDSDQLSVKYLDFVSRDGRKPFSIVCYDMNENGYEYTDLYVVIDSEEFDNFLDTY